MEKINKKALESGAVLLILKERFLDDKKEETLYPLLHCLHDSDVLVSKSDILKNNGKQYLPVFSNKEEIPVDYGHRFSTVVSPFLQCIEMAMDNKQLYGIVLDPFTKPMVLPKDILEMIPAFEGLTGDTEK